MIRQTLSLLAILLLCVTAVNGAPRPAPLLPVRPYAGIGVVVLPLAIANAEGHEPVILYREPGIGRLPDLDSARLPSNDQVFMGPPGLRALIVTARKSEWLRVMVDEGGREAWLKQRRSLRYQPWEVFLKTHPCRLLPGIRKAFYQLSPVIGAGAGEPLAPRQLVKAVRVSGDWAQVVTEQMRIGWIRWRDEDGRLLVSFDMAIEPENR